ncbi:hypothetical protein [Sporomusa carbonis]|uniref:hypothetical protein n=1 Tax=Sporomusa carbonis TaxID=3076075 RepID=UPI003C7AF0DB
MRPVIKNVTRLADIICWNLGDLYAAGQLERSCYAMEISPVYCDLAVKRWEKFTGKQAVRVESGDRH